MGILLTIYPPQAVMGSIPASNYTGRFEIVSLQKCSSLDNYESHVYLDVIFKNVLSDQHA